MMKNILNPISSWKLNDIDLHIIALALLEDLGQPYTDITTDTLFVDIKQASTATIVSKHSQPIIMCGLPIVHAILAKIGGDCQVTSDYHDGAIILPGSILLTLRGSPRSLLMVERVLLNFLQRLSAIATTTATFVNRIQHTTTQILDTRKTIPGFRHLEKYAVQCGGGVNHRMGLYDAIMIKDTHIDWLGGMQIALDKLPVNKVRELPVIVEVRNKEELSVVLTSGLNKVTRVLLDNMSLPLLSECVALCKGIIPTEASGNIHLDNVQAVAETGVDFISIGKITHSAGSVDLSMKCER